MNYKNGIKLAFFSLFQRADWTPDFICRVRIEMVPCENHKSSQSLKSILLKIPQYLSHYCDVEYLSYWMNRKSKKKFIEYCTFVKVL
jgi:hypothetical protein